jgi:cell division protein FtsB
LAQRPARPLTEDPGPDRRHRTKVRLPVARVAPKEKSVARTLRRRDAADGTFAAPASRMERRRAVSRRRARLVTVVCLGFCGLVLATSFPVSALMRQHRQMSAATSELHALSAGNQSLQKQVNALSDPANIATLARRDYDLVRPGQTAYTVLPHSGSPQTSATSSGHSTLDQGPVAPGSSESEALLGGGVSTSTGSSSGSPGVSSVSGQAQTATPPKSTPGLWSRVLGTLEFWR